MAEFNTYDILKQRYLLLTREALAVLKERVKQEPARRPAATAGRRAGRPGGLTSHGHAPPSPPVSSAAARSWSRTR